MVIGWRQIRSSRLVITFWPGLAAVCTLFSVTLALGLSGLSLELKMVAVWLGMSGLAVVCGLGMALALESYARGLQVAVKARNSIYQQI